MSTFNKQSDLVKLFSIEPNPMFPEEQSHKARFIKAPTGCGKSTAATHKMYEAVIDASDEAVPLLIITDDKSSMNQIHEQYLKTYDREINKDEVFLLQHETNGMWSRVQEGVRVVLTHHTYINRRNSMSMEHYELIQWVKDKSPRIIIDEADVVVEKAKINIQCGFRFTPAEGPQEEKYKREINTKNHVCPSYSKGGYRCGTCEHNPKTYMRDNGVYGGRIPANGGLSRLEWNDHPNFHDLTKSSAFSRYLGGEEVVLETSRAKLTKQLLTSNNNIMSTRELYVSEESAPPLVDGKLLDMFGAYDRVITDIVNCSFEPMLLTYKFDTKEIDRVREKIITKVLSEDKFKNEWEGSKKVLSEVHKRLIKHMDDEEIAFPYHACNVPMFQGYDMSGLNYLYMYCTELIMTSATLTDHQLRFLQAIMGDDLDIVSYEGATHKAVNNLLVITTDALDGEGQNVRFHNLIKAPTGTESYAKMISNVSPVKEYAKDEHNLSINGGKAVMFSAYMPDADTLDTITSEENLEVYHQGNFMHTTSDGKAIRATVSYSRSSLARGINMGYCRLLVTDKLAFKPAITLSWSNDKKTLEEHNDDEQKRLTVQAVGRIMRSFKYQDKDGTWTGLSNENGDEVYEDKVIIIHNASESFGVSISEALSPLCDGQVSNLHYKADLGDLDSFTFNEYDLWMQGLESSRHFFETGKVKKFDIANHDYLERTPWSKVSVSVKSFVDKHITDNNLPMTPDVFWNLFRKQVKNKRKVHGIIEMAKVFEGSYREFHNTKNLSRSSNKEWFTEDVKSKIFEIFSKKDENKVA